MVMTETGQDMARDINAFAASFMGGPMVDVVVRTTESYGKACLAWHEEILRFAATRLQRGSELGQALASTRSWADAAKLHQEWAASAIRDYTNETTRLFEIAADAGSKITESSVPAAAAAGRMGAEAARSATEAARSTGEAATRATAEAAESATDEARESRGSEGPRSRPARRAAPPTD